MHIYSLTCNCNSVRQLHAYRSPIMSVMVKLLAVNVFNTNMRAQVDKNSTYF